MHTQSKIMAVLLFLGSVLFMGCPTPVDPNADKTISINGIGWVMENVDQGFFIPSVGLNEVAGVFDLHWTGSAISNSDISYATMSSAATPGYHWTFPSSGYDAANQTLYSGRFYTEYYASNRSVFPIGLMNFTIGLTNGKTATYAFNIPDPASTTASSGNLIYNENYSGSPASNYKRIISRPTNISHTSGATKSVTFTLNDPQFYNGYLWLYDGSDNYVGITEFFRVDASGNLSSMMGGSLLNTISTTNTVTFDTTKVTYESGKTWADVVRFVLVTTDGEQFKPTKNSFDCRSISGRYTF